MSKEDMVHIYNVILAIKENEIMPYVLIWMDLGIVMLREVSQTEREKYNMTSLIFGI